MKSVSIIIPNWNGADLLRAYLPSVLEAQERYPGRVGVIVVDDASTDSSVKLLQEAFPGIKAVVHKHNQGFGKACWSGARAAEHPILIFLNSDVKVASDFIDPLVDCLEDQTIFAASPLIFDDEGKLSNVTIRITVLAIPGFSAAMRRRREEQNCIVNSEEKIFQKISSANQANRRAIESTVSS